MSGIIASSYYIPVPSIYIKEQAVAEELPTLIISPRLNWAIQVPGNIGFDFG